MPLDKIPKEEFLKLGISAKDLDILTHDLEHSCSKSSLMQCCSEWRCESCHVRHMHQEHKEKISTWVRFHQSSYLITGDKYTGRIEKKKKKRVELGRHKRTILEETSKEATELAESLSIQEIEELMALLKSL